MDVRRKTILLLSVAFCGIALALPILMPASDPLKDPLAPIGTLTSPASQSAEPAMMGPLHAQASAALDALQTGTKP